MQRDRTPVRSSRIRRLALASLPGRSGATGSSRVAVLHAPDLSGAVYANDRFAFGDADQARPGDPIGPFVVGGLEKASDGQHALVTRLRAGR